MGTGLIRRIGEAAVILALSAGMSSDTTFGATGKGEVRDDFLRREIRYGAGEKHQRRLDAIVDEIRSRMKKVPESKEDVLLLLEEMHRAWMKNSLYGENSFLFESFEERRLNQKIADFLKKEDVSSIREDDIASLDCDPCVKKFLEENLESISKVRSNIDGRFYFRDCESSFFYTRIGRALGIPLYAVSTPDGKHLFVRYDKDGMHNPYDKDDPINSGDIDWETTVGEERTDEHYLREDSQGLVADEKAMRNLKDDEALSVFYVNRGVQLGKLGMRDDEIRSYREALRLDPDNTTAKTYLEMTLSEDEEKDAGFVCSYWEGQED